MSADKHTANAPTYAELFTARMRVLELEEALRKARAVGLLAGAAFVRGIPEGTAQCREFLDIIDDALQNSTS
jgi:hypothetical protein